MNLKSRPKSDEEQLLAIILLFPIVENYINMKGSLKQTFYLRICFLCNIRLLLSCYEMTLNWGWDEFTKTKGRIYYTTVKFKILLRERQDS